MFASSPHIPVLLSEVVAALNPQPGMTFVDATLGLGGHTRTLLTAVGPKGRVFAFEQDPQMRELARARLQEFGAALTIIPQNFAALSSTLAASGIDTVDGMLFDLGISSLHLDTPERGFSFRHEGPLDMRLDPENNPISAMELVNSASLDELRTIFRTYGEEPRAALFARKIVERREQQTFHTTTDLAEFISELSPKGQRSGGGHPAALVFQALRIAVNRELEVLESALTQALPLLKAGGRIAVIAFHSLEDRIVKTFFNQYAAREKFQKYPQSSVAASIPERFQLQILTPKPITATSHEIANNPRARSARLRVAEKRA